jgi:putative ABC transport system permease protein
MTTLFQDLRYALRSLAKSPGFTAIAVATLALGIGANTSIFSVIRAVLLRDLPYPQTERLIVLREHHPHAGDMGVAWPTFLDWRERSRGFSALAGFRKTQANVSGGREPEMLRVAQVSANFFPLLGVRAELGRAFAEADDRPGAARTVMLSDGLWRTRFGADASIPGKTIRLDALPYTVVGVLPRSFGFFPERIDLYTPVGLNGAERSWLSRGNHSGMRVLARLSPGATFTSAVTEMDGIMRQLEREHPDSSSGQRAIAKPLSEALFGDVRAPLWILLAAVGLVLLIACVNVAHLLLARAASRQREFAIRVALGAGRRRLVRQLLTESLLLSALGGALGLLMAIWAIGPLLNLAPAEIPRLGDTRIDPVVLLFTLAASLVTGTLFGLAPAVQASRPDPQTSLRETGPGGTSGPARQRLRAALFVSEVALAFVLVVASALLVRSLVQVQSEPPGFNPAGVLALDVNLPDAKYPRERQQAFFSQAVAEVRRLPGVRSASAVLCPPFAGRCWGSVYLVSDRPAPAQADLPSSAFNVAEPAYFRTMEIPLLSGRFFTDADTADSLPVVIINESMARRWWPHESPLGKRIKQGFPQDDSPFREIVGVVGDVRQIGFDAPVQTEVYLPSSQSPEPAMTLVARTASAPMSLAHAAAAAVRRVDPEQSVSEVQPAMAYLAESVAGRRYVTVLLGLFGALALLLASVGIYGVVSYGVARRTREIGIRTALGARPADVLGLILGQALRMAALGMGVGALAAFGLTRFLASLLYGVAPWDPPTFGGVAALLTGVVLAACSWPARRAMSVDPSLALRGE